MASDSVLGYSIVYSEETRLNSDPELIILDNTDNKRPDWAEYWPIRRFLLETSFREDCLYGFFSPRFHEKMGFHVGDVLGEVSELGSGYDVVSLSPYFDFMAVFKNLFEQCEFFQPGFVDVSQKVMDSVIPGVRLRELVNDFDNSIYCNYFFAKPPFWRAWLDVCERIFLIAESGGSLSGELSLPRFYGRNLPMPTKVFVIERIASLLLSVRSDFKCRSLGRSTLSPDFSWLPVEVLRAMDVIKRTPLMDVDLYRAIQKSVFSSARSQARREYFVNESCALGVGHEFSDGYDFFDYVERVSVVNAAPKPSFFDLFRWGCKL